MWDPFTLEVVYTIEPFTSPVVNISISDELEQIFITGADKIIRIYHNITYEVRNCMHQVGAMFAGVVP